MTRHRAPASAEPWTISFTLSRPTPLLNTMLRQHWGARRKETEALAWEVAAAVAGQRPTLPFPRAKIVITRFSIGRIPDFDGLYGGVKSLLDCFLPVSERHPFGLSLIHDDNPDCLRMRVIPVHVGSRAEQKTTVFIQRVDKNTSFEG